MRREPRRGRKLRKLELFQVLRDGDLPAPVPAQLVGEGERDLLFAVGQEQAPRRRFEGVQPSEEPSPVGVGREAQDLLDAGPDRLRLAEDADRRGSRR